MQLYLPFKYLTLNVLAPKHIPKFVSNLYCSISYCRALLGIEYKIGYTYTFETLGERGVARKSYPSEAFSLNKSDTVKVVTLGFCSIL